MKNSNYIGITVLAMISWHFWKTIMNGVQEDVNISIWIMAASYYIVRAIEQLKEEQ